MELLFLLSTICSLPRIVCRITSIQTIFRCTYTLDVIWIDLKTENILLCGMTANCTFSSYDELSARQTQKLVRSSAWLSCEWADHIDDVPGFFQSGAVWVALPLTLSLPNIIRSVWCYSTAYPELRSVSVWYSCIARKDINITFIHVLNPNICMLQLIKFSSNVYLWTDSN